MHAFQRALSLLAVAAVALLLAPGSALAHETRKVGPFQFTVGWLSEPPVVGQPNGISLEVTNTGTGQRVEGLTETLKAEATAEGKTLEFGLEADDEEPGHYLASFVPTAEGQYTFRFFGKINQQQVDERFESGPGRFDEPEKPVAFPAAQPDLLAIQQQLNTTQSAANSARLLGIIGIVVGVLGGGLGIVAMSQSRKKAS